jgi:tetratricopeptide (TPR) repeat protein
MTNFAQALRHAQRGEFAAAEQILTAVTQSEPKNADAFHLLANVLHAKGDIPGALKNFAAAAKLAPTDPVLAFNHAAVLASVNRHEEAVASFDRALALKPNDAEATFARGGSLAALQRYEDALAAYDAARAAGLTDRPELYANKGSALAALGRHKEAIDALDRALAANPNDVGANFNRGGALFALKRNDEALEALNRALARAPNHIMAHSLRAPIQAEAGRFSEGLADADFAIAREPNRVEHLKRRAYVLSVANRRAEALEMFDQILARAPDDPEALYGKADALLSEGDFANGLDFYEQRFGGGKVLLGKTPDSPRWTGAEPIDGKTILIQAEQGFGDLFQFCRFIPLLAERGARVIMQEREQTHTLLRSLPGLSEVVPLQATPPHDFHIPLCSLMRAFDLRVETIPANIPYLSAPPKRIEQWGLRLGPTQRRRVGICWGGLAYQALQRARSLDLQSLDRLLGAPAQFISLQFDADTVMSVLAKHNVPEFGPDTTEFSELAALIENLDLVVTIDTNVAHLAGALGKPMLLMLPHTADWRWLQNRDDSPWYPNARLFRQTRWNDWSDVVERVTQALQT